MGVLLEEMVWQRNYGGTRDFKLMRHRCRWTFFGLIVVILMIFFLGVCVYATFKMIQAGHQQYDEWKINIIVCVMSLIFLSFVDNPWIYYKIKTILTKKRNKATNEVMLHPVKQYSDELM